MAEQANLSKSASRLDLGHFDPDGVRELTQSSAQARVRSIPSDGSLASEEPFSLEETIRAALGKYARSTIRPSAIDILTTEYLS